MGRRTLFFVLAAQSMLAAAASAQMEPATFSPAVPTQNDQIRATFTRPNICNVVRESIVVTGTTIRHDLIFGGCIIGPPSGIVQHTTVFGPLAANTYTYEIYYDLQTGDPPDLRSRQTLVVSAATAPIPALSPTLLIVLILSLISVAIVALGRAS